MPHSPAHPMVFAMPGFAQLAHAGLAELMTFIRNSCSNHASPVTEADIARMRHGIANKAIHYAPEAGQ